MTFLYGTNLECLFSLPAIGATLAATANTCVSGTAPVFQLPALGNIWTPSQLQGKGLMILAAGGYDLSTGAGTQNTMRLTFDVAAATTAATSVTVATTGAATWPNGTTGIWEAQIWMNCVSTGTVSTWYANGQLTAAGTQATAPCTTFLWGNSIAAGIPTAVTIPTTQPYYVDLYAQWASAPTAFVVSQYMIFGIN